MKKKLLPLLLLLSFLTHHQPIVAGNDDNNKPPSDGKTKIILGTIIAVPSACLAVGSFFYKMKLKKDISDLKSKIQEATDETKKRNFIKNLKSKSNVLKWVNGGIWGGAALTVLGGIILGMGLIEKSEYKKYEENMENNKLYEEEQEKIKKENEAKNEYEKKAKPLIESAKAAQKDLSKKIEALKKKETELGNKIYTTNRARNFSEANIYEKTKEKIVAERNLLEEIVEKYEETIREHEEKQNIDLLKTEVEKIVSCNEQSRGLDNIESYIKKLNKQHKIEIENNKKKEEEEIRKRELEKVENEIKPLYKETFKKIESIEKKIKDLEGEKYDCECSVRENGETFNSVIKLLLTDEKNASLSKDTIIPLKEKVLRVLSMNYKGAYNKIRDGAKLCCKTIKEKKAELKLILKNLEESNKTYSLAVTKNKNWKNIKRSYSTLFNSSSGYPVDDAYLLSPDNNKLKEKQDLLKKLKNFLSSEVYKEL